MHRLTRSDTHPDGEFSLAARHGCRSEGMVNSRMSNVEKIRARVDRAHYEVNTAAVAAAIVDRLLAGRLLANEVNR